MSSTSFVFADFLLAMLQYSYPLQDFLLRFYNKEVACNTNDSKTITIDKFCNKLRRNRDFELIASQSHLLQILMDSQTLARD